MNDCARTEGMETWLYLWFGRDKQCPTTGLRLALELTERKVEWITEPYEGRKSGEFGRGIRGNSYSAVSYHGGGPCAIVS